MTPAERQLFERWRRFARRRAARFAARFADCRSIRDDLEQEALVVLWRCIRSYDVSRESSFGAYLNRALTRALARTARRYVGVASGYGNRSRAAFDRGELPDYEWARALTSAGEADVSADARRIVDLLTARVPASRRQDVPMFLACELGEDSAAAFAAELGVSRQRMHQRLGPVRESFARLAERLRREAA